MQLFVGYAAVAIGFAIAGGWLIVKTTESFAGRTLPMIPATVASGVFALWAIHVVFGAVAIVLSLCLAWGLLALAAVDWLAFRLPDRLTLPLAAAGLIASALLPAAGLLDDVILAPLRSATQVLPFHVGSAGVEMLSRVSVHAFAATAAYLAMALIAWLYLRVRGREGMGFGDAKLAAAAGAWLGLEPLPSVLLLASIAGIIWILVAALIRGRAALSQRIPFGLPLSLAIWIVWLYGPIGTT
jgi:leader peptidase (prepilin peptidase)/N-methyltransferase